MIQFDSRVCQDLKTALSREWLETNGLGGYASSTIVGLNTRRYHGLLVAALKPPVDRFVLLSKLEETLIIDGRRYGLSANQYHNTVYPQGHQYLVGFRLDPFPIFTYKVEDIEIEKSVFMVHGENTTIVQYRLSSQGESADTAAQRTSISLEVRPLIAFREFHQTTHENNALNPQLTIDNNVVSIMPYEGLRALHFTHDAQHIDTQGYWFRNFEYEREFERGLDLSEDLFSPLAFNFDLSQTSKVNIIASTHLHEIGKSDWYRKAEIKRREELRSLVTGEDDFMSALTIAADQFIVKRGDQKSIIAGYHWFNDWGRDTLIALPGLTLATGRFETARSVLAAFVRHVDQGMIPNQFTDAGKAEYNAVDATLWLFEAVRSFVVYTKDYHFVKAHLYNVMADIISWHLRGTRFGIRVDKDGLIQTAENGMPLTWMDAKINEWVVTPRYGKPVEVQALWYNALRVMEDFSEIFGDTVNYERYKNLAARVHRNFNHLFWNPLAGCLYDVVNGNSLDSSIRPNQILAVSLHYSVLSKHKAKSVLDVVERELLTPLGLRSLSPKDPQYSKRYEGDLWNRDTAYHQGTVWPWLMGQFVTGYLKVHHHNAESLNQVKDWLKNFEAHLCEAGIGQVSEIFDAEPPHPARGCIAQAWSVAELLRVYVEHLYPVKPVDRRENRVRLT